MCGASLLNVSHLPVCEACLSAIRPITAETCALCGEALPGVVRDDQASLCSACQELRPLFDKAVAYGAYDGELRELIHLLKYERVLPAARALGRMLSQAVAKLDLPSPFLVIPVPLHSAKRRQRGFNQAELIAREASKGLSHAEVAAKVLARVRATASQIGLTRSQRIENMRGAFRVVHPNKVSGRSILLVDDVLTTGTTASECARVLRKAGAKQVLVATVARTLKNFGQGTVVAMEWAEAS